MSQFSVHILGCGSATPSLRHQPACQIIDFRDRLMMVDCGEGAQLAMRRQRLKFSRLRDIFISHLHGDHLLGLPGLLSTMDLSQVGGNVNIYIFEEGAELLRNILKVVCPDPGFNISYNIIKPEYATIVETQSISVSTIPLFHRIPAVGFVFREKKSPRRLRPDMAAAYDIPVWQLNNIKAGEDFVMPDGSVIANSRLTEDPPAPASYAYVSDTAFDPRLITGLRGVDVIYHEATYADDNAHKAAIRGHCTARQAGCVARRAGAKHLVLGHFSKAYFSEEDHVTQAAEEFTGKVTAANEGMIIKIK